MSESSNFSKLTLANLLAQARAAEGTGTQHWADEQLGRWLRTYAADKLAALYNEPVATPPASQETLFPPGPKRLTD